MASTRGSGRRRTAGTRIQGSCRCRPGSPAREAPATGHMMVDDPAATGVGLSPLFEADEAEQQLEGTHAFS